MAERQKAIPRKIRILMSPIATVGTVLIWFAGLGMLIFILSYEPARNANIFGVIFIVVTLSIAIIIIPIYAPRSILATITIDETGVTKSFLGRFCKLHMSWDEMAEVVFSPFILSYMGIVWFSKTQKVSTVAFKQRSRVKNVIPISLNKRRYNVINQYIKQPIVGLSEERIKSLGLDKD